MDPSAPGHLEQSTGGPRRVHRPRVLVIVLVLGCASVFYFLQRSSPSVSSVDLETIGTWVVDAEKYVGEMEKIFRTPLTPEDRRKAVGEAQARVAIELRLDRTAHFRERGAEVDATWERVADIIRIKLAAPMSPPVDGKATVAREMWMSEPGVWRLRPDPLQQFEGEAKMFPDMPLRRQ